MQSVKTNEYIMRADALASLHSVRKISARNVLIGIFAVQVTFSLALQYFSYVGDTSQQTIEQILTYFTADDIQNGIEYDRAGFTSNLIARLIGILLTISFVFTPLSTKIETYFSSRSKNSFILLCLYYLTAYFIIYKIIYLPFNYYF